MTDTLDLATGPVLMRAAATIESQGHVKNEFATGDGYCTAGAIGTACGLEPEDWYDDHAFAPAIVDYETSGDAYDEACRAWKASRRAALAAARTLVGRVTPTLQPEQMSRRELLEHISEWNDADDRTAAQVSAAMRAAAAEAGAV